MEGPFIYDSYVTGRDFVGRKEDLNLLKHLVFQGENVALYGVPGVGKQSLIRQMLTQAGMTGESFVVADISLMRARSTEDVLTAVVTGLLKSCASSPAEYKLLIEELLSDTHFVFDRELYDTKGDVVSANWLLDDLDIQRVVAMPAALVQKKDIRLIVLVNEFQCVSFSPDAENILMCMEKELSRKQPGCTYIFTGSHMNAMKDIFEGQRWFWRSVERFQMQTPSVPEFADYVFKGFQSRGKVVDKSLITVAVETLNYNWKYISHLFSIVNGMAIGYINSDAISEGISILMSIHQPRFYAAICNLTDFQLNMLKAVIDGELRFSSLSVIDRYHLNSSANVKRLKDALVKKEIIWFDHQDEPHLQDPLFEYWLRKVYFAL